MPAMEYVLYFNFNPRSVSNFGDVFVATAVRVVRQCYGLLKDTGYATSTNLEARRCYSVTQTYSIYTSISEDVMN